MEPTARALPGLRLRPDAYAAAEGADSLVLMTEWNQFRNLDLARLKTVMRQPVLLDLRNVYEPELAETAGFQYEGVGRGTAGARPRRGPVTVERSETC
jgi:UDPglucose 6-dehydrogenase